MDRDRDASLEDHKGHTAAIWAARDGNLAVGVNSFVVPPRDDVPTLPPDERPRERRAEREVASRVREDVRLATKQGDEFCVELLELRRVR